MVEPIQNQYRKIYHYPEFTMDQGPHLNRNKKSAMDQYLWITCFLRVNMPKLTSVVLI